MERRRRVPAHTYRPVRADVDDAHGPETFPRIDPIRHAIPLRTHDELDRATEPDQLARPATVADDEHLTTVVGDRVDQASVGEPHRRVEHPGRVSELLEGAVEVDAAERLVTDVDQEMVARRRP